MSDSGFLIWDVGLFLMFSHSGTKAQGNTSLSNCYYFTARARIRNSQVYTVTIKASAQNWYILSFPNILLAKASKLAKPEVKWVQKYISSVVNRPVPWHRALIYNLLLKKGGNIFEIFTLYNNQEILRLYVNWEETQIY